MNYWLHRISHIQNVSRPLLEKGYLSIGFSDFSNEDFLVEVAEKKNRRFMDSTFKEHPNWEYLPQSRFSLWRFLAEMRAGDWVVVPAPMRAGDYWVEAPVPKTFSVYELCDDLPNLPSDDGLDLPDTDRHGRRIVMDSPTSLMKIEGEEKPLDIGFLRKVSVVCKDIPRDGFADAALTSRMKVRQTNTDISDLAENLHRAVEAFKAGKPINLKAELVEKSIDSWKSVMLNDLNPDKFERLVWWYFLRAGATEVAIPPKNQPDKSGDVDVTAVFEEIRTIISVQVKFHQGETDDVAIQQIQDFAQSQESLSDGYNRQYWVVSSADTFSENALNLARETNVQLICGKEFVEMLLNVGIGGLDSFGG